MLSAAKVLQEFTGRGVGVEMLQAVFTLDLNLL